MQRNSVFTNKPVRILYLLYGPPESPQKHCLKSRRTMMSPLAGSQNSSVNPKSTRDEARFHCIGSRAIQHSTSYMTSGLTSFRQLQRFPETPVSSLEEQLLQHSNKRKSQCTPYCLEERADSLASTEKVCQLSTSTSKGGFPQQ